MADQGGSSERKSERYVVFAWLSFLLPVISVLFFVSFLNSSFGNPLLNLFITFIVFCLPMVSFFLGVASLGMRMNQPKEMRSTTALVLSILGMFGIFFWIFLIIDLLAHVAGA